MEFDPDAYLASEPAIATTFADPEDIRRYRAAKARGLSDQQAFKVGDNGVGKWGDDTTRPDDPIVALPRDSPAAQHNQLVEISGPAGTTVARVADVMPKRSNIRNGASIDLNPAASAAVGATGKTPVNVRILRNPAEGFDPDAYLGIQKQAPAAAPAAAFNPDAYLGTDTSTALRAERALPEEIAADKQAAIEQDAATGGAPEGARHALERIVEISNTPLLPHAAAPQQEGTGMQIVAGINNAAGALAEGLSTPTNLALIPLGAVKGIGRAAGAVFGTKMLSDIPEQIRAAENAPTVQQRLEGGLGVIGNLVLGSGALVHASGVGAKPKMQTVGKSFADIPDSVAVPEVEAAPIPAARTEAAPFDPNGYLGQTGTVISPGTIPIEGLPAAEQPAVIPSAAEAPRSAPADAPPALFREDDSLPFMTKVRIEDELKAGGLTDEHIAQMTTPAVQGAIDQLRASKEPPTTPTIQTSYGALDIAPDEPAIRGPHDIYETPAGLPGGGFVLVPKDHPIPKFESEHAAQTEIDNFYEQHPGSDTATTHSLTGAFSNLPTDAAGLTTPELYHLRSLFVARDRFRGTEAAHQIASAMREIPAGIVPHEKVASLVTNILTDENLSTALHGKAPVNAQRIAERVWNSLAHSANLHGDFLSLPQALRIIAGKENTVFVNWDRPVKAVLRQTNDVLNAIGIAGIKEKSARRAEPPALTARQAEAEYQQSLLEEAQQYQRTSGDEFLSALIESGGLPARNSPHRSGTFTGEIARLEEFARDPNRAEPVALNRLFRNDAPAPDELATRLRDRGFDTPTADDVYTLAEQRLRTGQEIYGQPPQVFASGSAAPRKPSGAFYHVTTAENAAKILQEGLRPATGERSAALGETSDKIYLFRDKRAAEDAVVNWLGEQFPDDAKLVALKVTPPRGVRVEQEHGSFDFTTKQQIPPAHIEIDKTFDGSPDVSTDESGKRFASGAAAPAQPHQPAPRPAPAPRTPPPSTPAVASAVAPLKSWWQQRTLGIRKLVAPQTIDRSARMVANIVRDYNGQLANRIIQADHALAAARADFDRTPVPSRWQYDPKQPLPRNYAFMAESEKGGANLSTADRALKTQLDTMFEQAVDEVHRVKPTALQSLIQDYFPHIWQDPAAAQKAYASIVGTRPLEGSKSFLKQRALAYIEEGLKLGLRPVSDNPIDVVLTKLHEVHKFVAAQDILTEAKAIGARKFVYIFEKPPEGWAKVDDPSSRVNAPPFVTVAEAFDEQMKVKTLELLDNLGIPHQRVASLGGKRWGDFTTGGAGIRTKFAGPLSVYWHELGHALQERYKWLDVITRGERPGGQSPIAKELRALADLRAEGQPPNKSFKSYIRNADEKAAVLLEAYMHAPQRMRDVAPLAYGRVQKFIAAHPELAPINDIRPSLVLGRGKMDVPVGGLVTLGHYYMPEGAATVLSNYLSPGLQRFGLIRSIRQSTNILSGLQLGFSAFHAGFTSIDAAVSSWALGLQYLSEGQIGKGVSRIAMSPLAPVTNYYTGKAVQTAMIDPAWAGKVKLLGRTRQLSPHGEMVTNEIAQLAMKAGLRATVDPFWKTQTTRNMMRAWNEGGVKGYAGTVLRLPFALSEQMMRPILEHLVPRQKLGVFAGMAQHAIERLGPNADIHAIRDSLARAADATEDRMGQMTYDNLFYNRIIRDAALIGFRAYGWTLGKYRALAGGFYDTATTVSRVRAGGEVLTPRMAYLIALPMLTATLGSIMNYTMTGQAPQDWRDALMPRTGRMDRNGNPERLSLPTYIKDILSDWHDFPSTKKMLVSFAHKLNPWLSVASDVINNADFYNTKIANEDDPILQQQWDKVKFVMLSARPFSVTSTLKLNESNPTVAQQMLPFFGFVPAKAALSMTPAQARAAELSADMLPQGARTGDQAEHAKLVSTLLRDRRANDPGFYNAIEEARATGQLHTQDRGRIERASQLTPFQYQLKRLSVPDAMKVWDLASDAEKLQIRGIILQKIGASKTLTSEQRTHYTQVIANSTR